MKAPLLFDPTGGVFFDTRTNEGTKLTRLGSEGRSTSTTITAFSILNQLENAGFMREDQKLLSFTDNRQDAALQAGHFNDFVQVVRLRAGIRKALEVAPSGFLTHATIGEAVFQALGLPFLDFANKNEEPVLAPVRRKYEACFQDYLFYRVIADLRRSWRIVLPNLEQCALLSISYADMDEISATDSFWKNVPLLGILDHSERKDFLCTILDWFRLEHAIHSENHLTQSRIRENEKHFRELLRPPWTLDRNEELREPYFVRYDPSNRNAGFYSKSMGPSSALGKYIKLYARRLGLDIDLKGENYRAFIHQVMAMPEGADYLISQTARNEKNQEVPIYRLRLDKILWMPGDLKTVKNDAIKQRSYRNQAPEPNKFFQALYCRDFSGAKRLRGEDHTGQIGTDARIEREERFGKGDISALFCSPTMELGIDIRNLSVVHMRNAPPNPSNYAQRSGRAGRSGQAALVFAYCSSYAPHDRHYFQEQESLVAGAVMAPRLDLCNQELLTTHLHALMISEIGLPGLDDGVGARSSIMRLIMDDNDKMPLTAAVRSGLKIPPMMFNTIKATFKRVIRDFEDDLYAQAAPWYFDQWIEQNLAQAGDHLDRALDRWRRIYRPARTILTRATQKIEGGTLSLGSDEYRKHKRNQDQATRQLDLLRKNLSGKSAEFSEFYPYRYLASEAFLPGYNFTRLPVRVFLPTSDSSGDFISRPRAIALREFGPLNIIYHNGRKYRVCQLIVQDTELSFTEAKISKKTGYFLTGDQKDLEICPFSGQNLGDNANTEHLHDLIAMAESRAEEIDRISCEEEERIFRGFDIRTFFSVDGGQLERVHKAVARTSENTLLNLCYIPAARLIHVNTRWRAQEGDGFPMGLVSGDWRSRMPGPEQNFNETFRLVKLWTSNLADALYIEPIQPLGLNPDGVKTLQHALKRAIESVFKVEANEIGVVSVGDPAVPNILIFEASEGSLGILSQFVENIRVFREVVAQAISICRYDDQKYKGPASYDDLLSYYNQRDHKIIDRHLIKGALDKLLTCSIELRHNQSFSSYDEQYRAMLKSLDPNSSTEKKFIDYLYANGLRLPDAAQKRVEGVFVQPGKLVSLRGRDWIVLPSEDSDVLVVKPLGGFDDEITGIYLPLDIVADRPIDASFQPPTQDDLGDISTARVLAVVCLPHLCEQWQTEIQDKLDLDAVIIRSNTQARLDRRIQGDTSVFDFYPYQVISIDFIKSDHRRDVFIEQCPELFIVDEAAAREKASRSIFSQNAIKAHEIEADLQEVDEAIGDPMAVETFVVSTLENIIGVQVIRDKKGFRIIAGNIPPQIRELLPPGEAVTVSFESPTPEGYHYLGRNNPFVEQLCQLVLANTLDRVDKRAARASSNLSPQSRANFLENELKILNMMSSEFDAVAEQQSKKLVAAHERFSALMDARRFQVVYPVLPMDLLGVYILLPER